MVNQFKKIGWGIFFVLYGTNTAALTLGVEEKKQIDLGLLRDKVLAFHSIATGMALALTKCADNDTSFCSLAVDKHEIRELISILDAHIRSLTLKQKEMIHPNELDEILSAYMTIRDNYSSKLEKLHVGSRFSQDEEEKELLDLDESAKFDSELDFYTGSKKDQELQEYLNDIRLYEDEELTDNADTTDTLSD